MKTREFYNILAWIFSHHFESGLDEFDVGQRDDSACEAAEIKALWSFEVREQCVDEHDDVEVGDVSRAIESKLAAHFIERHYVLPLKSVSKYFHSVK